MDTFDIKVAKQANPQVDGAKLDDLLEQMRAIPRRTKRGYRLAPIGSHRVYTEEPWNNSPNVYDSRR